ncbi:MAG TPA: HD domain-containing protein [Nitrososphaera sp.]|nr:HD domain-containing protein [Nitrososphaera sp.]
MKSRARSAKLESARKFAKDKHRHQVRKDGKTPYWHHLRQVVRNLSAIGITDKEILCAGWLHDTIEDTDTDYDDLAAKFGDRAARIVAEVTKDKTLPEREKERAFCEKLSAASWEAQAVKLCDLWANLADIESGYRKERRSRQFTKALRYFVAIKSSLEKNSKRLPRLEKGINEIDKMKKYRTRLIALR